MMMDTTVPQTEMDALLLGRTKELTEVIEHNGSRNWKGIGISFLVITLISCVIFSTVLFFSPELKDLVDDQQRKELISLDEIINMNYYPKHNNASYLNDSSLIYKDEYYNLIIASINDNGLDQKIWVKNITFNEWGSSPNHKFTISADHQYLIFSYDSRQVYRHSTKSKFRVLTIKDETTEPIQPDNFKVNQFEQAELNFVSWSPKGNSLIFAYNNNLYFRPTIKSPTQQVTFSKVNNQKFGIPDWLYEEEILSKDQAVWWSPNAKSFAYAKFDDSEVKNVSFSWYGGFDDKPSYPPLVTIPYPKVGFSNPVISLFVNRIEANGILGKQVEVKPPKEVPSENYLTTFQWIDDESAIVQWANRVQNESFFSQCTKLGTPESNCKLNLNFRPSEYGWVDILNEAIVDKERSVYYIKMSSYQSDQFGSFKHLAQVKLNQLNNQNQVKILTSGLFEVVDILALDETKNEIYYQATEQFKPANRQIMKLDIKTGLIECISCKLNPNCFDFNALISPMKSSFILTCNGPIIPYVELRNLPQNKKILSLENNTEISETLSKKYLPKIKRFMLPIGKYNASVKMLLPPGLREHEIGKYPMLINTYAGGYASSQVLADDSKNLVKCAISVAPTTDWLYYDSAYTERYMGLPTPEDNLEGYKNSSLLNKAHKIKSNKLLLVHGSSDDNVHLQHSMLFIKQLNLNNIMFQLQIYPDQDHGLISVGKHVYSTMSNFITECFELNQYNDQIAVNRDVDIFDVKKDAYY